MVIISGKMVQINVDFGKVNPKDVIALDVAVYEISGETPRLSLYTYNRLTPEMLHNYGKSFALLPSDQLSLSILIVPRLASIQRMTSDIRSSIIPRQEG